MNKYTYKAKDASGKYQSGDIEAADEKQASSLLRDHGLFVINVKEKSGSIDFNNIQFAGVGGISEDDIAHFTRYLSTMLSVGLPLTDALANLQNLSSGALAVTIASISRDITGGSNLSGAMAKFPKVFNNLYINLVKAGEASGSVDQALARLAETLEKSAEFKGKVKGAMVYPTIVVIVMAGVMVLMLTFVVPTISEVYKQFGADLPLPTKVLIFLSEIFTKYTFFLIAGIVAAVLGIRAFNKTPAGSYFFSNLSFKYPVLGKLNMETTLAIVSRTLGALVGAGVSIIDALKITSGTMGNNVYREGLLAAVNDVEKGFPLSLSLKNNLNFPQIMAQMIGIGEETGTVDKSLLNLAVFFEGNAERRVKGLTASLEPILLVVMGVAVGGLAIAVLMPMFNLVNVIK